MMEEKFNFQCRAVTIVGGAGFSSEDLNICLAKSSTLISADGGVNSLDENNYQVDFIIGDLDSLTNKQAWESRGTKIVEIKEQDSTDFEKCLYSIDAEIYFCVGFIGGRTDHFLAVCSSLVKYASKRIILVGSDDIVFHLPEFFEIDLPVSTRLSLFPMQKIIGINSSGLRWPVSGIEFDPCHCVGTSNKTTAPTVTIRVSNCGMLILLPRFCLPNVIEAFQA